MVEIDTAHRVEAEMRTSPHSYIPLVMAFWSILLALPLVSRRFRHADPAPQSPLDLAQLCAGTYYVSRVIARERAGSFLREPFIHALGGANQPSSSDQQPAAPDVRAALGELVTCTRCVGLWVAAGLAYMQALAPRESRVVMPVLSAAAVNNFLQAEFAQIVARTNIAERTSEQQHDGIADSLMARPGREQDGQRLPGEQLRSRT